MDTAIINQSDMVHISDRNQTEDVLENQLSLIPLICGYTIVIVGTVVGNLMVIVAFLRYEDVRAVPTNIIIFSLSVSDFLVGSVILPFNLVWGHGGYWMFGEVFCRIWGALDYILTFMSIASIITISFDRFLLVTTKGRYRTVWSRRRASLVCCTSWLCSITGVGIATLSFRHLDLVDFETECDLEFVYLLPFTVLLLMLQFAIPFVLLTLLNCKVYYEIYKRSRNLGRVRVERDIHTVDLGSAVQLPSTTTTNVSQCEDTNSPTGNQTSTSTGNKGAQLIRVPGQSGTGGSQARAQQIDSLKKKAQQFSKHRKAAITLSILVGTFVCCWLPYQIFRVIEAICGDAECFSEPLWEAANGLLWGNSMLNPILYGLTNPLLRRRMLGSCRPTRAVGHS